MKSLDITEEEAKQLIADDEEDFIGEDGERMEEKAKHIKRYEKADTLKKKLKAPKERKVDENKAYIMGILHKALENVVKITKVQTETEINFVHNDEEYTVKIIKHRKKK